MEKNDWLGANLQHKAEENFQVIFMNPPCAADSYMNIAEVMQLREFTIASLMNIPIQLPQEEAERVCGNALNAAVEKVFKMRASYIQKNGNKLSASEINEDKQIMELIATAAPKGKELLRNALKEMDRSSARS